MGYTLAGVIGHASVLSVVAKGQADIAVLPLRQGLALVPMSGDLFDTVADGTSDNPAGFWSIPGGFDRVLCAWSSVGPVAYVEADYFGGVGDQRAALWHNGALAFGPVWIDGVQPVPAEGTPISQVLSRLGVIRDGYADEFEAAGLQRHRHTEEWLP
jgi:hypothetical protein